MKIIVNNIAVEYQDEGQGPLILFFHGWWDSLKTFNQLTPYLNKRWRIVRLDLPGFGGTETPAEDWDLDRYVDFVKAFIKKLNLPVEILAGHSMGGRIVIKGLASGKLSAKRAILIASAGNNRRFSIRNFVLKILAKIGKLISLVLPADFWQKKIRRPFYKKLGSDYAEAGVLKNTLINIIEEGLTAAAAKITIPVLLIWGEKDKVTPVEDGKKFHQIIKNSILRIIEGTGHFVHQEEPKKVGEEIKKFLLHEKGND